MSLLIRGHLLTIHSADENKKVMEWAANYVEPDESGKWHVWIGLDKNKLVFSLNLSYS